MSNPELDLSRYEEAVAEHLLFGLARMHAFGARTVGKRWNVDLGKGELAIEDVGTFGTQILGTWAHDSDTFLWAWANPGAHAWAGSLAIAGQLRARGAREQGLAPFVQPRIAPRWVDPLELALTAGELSGRLPLYTPAIGQATALLLVQGTGLEAFEPEPITIGSLMAAASERTTLAPRRLVEPFLRRLRFDVDVSNASTRAKRAAASLHFDWLPDGRLEEMNAHFAS